MGAHKASKRYRGKGALFYEEKRAGKRKWTLENEGVESLLPTGISTVLDVPVGTGRYYQVCVGRGLAVTGVDTSPDMLSEAKRKGMTDLHLANILDLPFASGQFDLSLCIRLLPWFEPDEVRASLVELARVSDIIIAGIRTKDGDPFCKNESLWNHSHSAFLGWVEGIGYQVDDVFHVGNKGNDIYRLTEG